MYEVQACGVTLEFTTNHGTAAMCFEHAVSPEVTLYKYDSNGNKRIVNHRIRGSSTIHSKVVSKVA